MTIAIDIGNTSVKIALVEGGQIGSVIRVPTRDLLGPRQIGAILVEANMPTDPPQLVAMVSVVPVWAEAVERLVNLMDARLMRADLTTIPIRVLVGSPELVGADRILAAWTSRELYGAPGIVIDLGTATTVDGVDAAGSFVGGAIVAGPSLAIAALSSGTAQLPSVAVRDPEHAIGRNTMEAIQSGAVLGHIESVSGLVARVRNELGATASPVRVTLIGGLSRAAWAREIEGVDVVDPDLLLRGLELLARHHSLVGERVTVVGR